MYTITHKEYNDFIARHPVYIEILAIPRSHDISKQIFDFICADIVQEREKYGLEKENRHQGRHPNTREGEAVGATSLYIRKSTQDERTNGIENQNSRPDSTDIKENSEIDEGGRVVFL